MIRYSIVNRMGELAGFIIPLKCGCQFDFWYTEGRAKVRYICDKHKGDLYCQDHGLLTAQKLKR